MPYHTVKSAKCPVSKPWAAAAKVTGEIMGCHPTKADAVAQVGALQSNVNEGNTMIEQRDYRPTEIRVEPENPKRFEADVLTYGVKDSYGTIFDRGVFDESLSEALPRITWGHDWTDPIGRWVDWKNMEERDEKPSTLRLIGELDDFRAVPRAHQASAQLASGTINQFSVGFHRHPDGTYKDDDDVEHFRSAGLDEVALVLVGAVPGTKLISVRSGGNGVPEDLVIDLAKAVAAGTLTKAAALIAVDLAAGTGLGMVPDPPGESEDPGPDPAVGSPGPSDVDLSAAEAVLSDLGL